MKGCCWQTLQRPAEGADLYPQTEARIPVALDPRPWQPEITHAHMFTPYAKNLTLKTLVIVNQEEKMLIEH